MLYSPAIEQRFRQPQYAGPAQPQDLTGRAQTPGSSAVLALYLQVEQGMIVSARFQALGCPSCIAAGDWVCEWLVGRELDDLADRAGSKALKTQQIESALELTPSKRHVALLVEDALADAIAQALFGEPPLK